MQASLKLTLKQRQSFYFNLGSLLLSSLDILTAMELIIEEERSDKIRTGYNHIVYQLQCGHTFSEAFEMSVMISAYEKSTIQAGETSGNLAEVISQLSEYYRKKRETRRQLVSLFAYPAILLVTSFSILYFMMAFMVPMFTESFRHMNMELPMVTQLVINLAEFIRQSFPFLLFVLIFMSTTFLMISKSTVYKTKCSDLLFRIPLIREALMTLELQRFLVMMSMLLSSKVQITEALILASETSLFPTFKAKIRAIEHSIMQGTSIHESFCNSNLFPVKLTTMVKMSEETNSLHETFEELGSQYHRSAIEFQQLIKSVAEPILILVMGCIAGTIVIGMYLPIFQLSMVE